MSLPKEPNSTLAAKLNLYESEIENGIFNMIISLCHQKANDIGLEEAKLQVSNWLERITIGLREEIEETI